MGRFGSENGPNVGLLIMSIQGNSQVPPELPKSAAQQPRQTQQGGHIEHL